METIYSQAVKEQITKRVNQIAENSADSHWKRKRVYSIIRTERKLFLLWRKNQLKDFFCCYIVHNGEDFILFHIPFALDTVENTF